MRSHFSCVDWEGKATVLKELANHNPISLKNQPVQVGIHNQHDVDVTPQKHFGMWVFTLG